MTQTLTAPARPPADHLPTPPDDAEKYWYLGRQNRWLLAVQALSFCLIAYSVARFATADDHLLLFLVPMSLYAVTMLISLNSSTRRRRVDRLDHELRVDSYRPDVYPSVDVFLPTAGEPLDLLANTYSHVQRLAWPAEVRVWVLDDGARPEVAELAAAAGFEYSVRPDRGRLKKAGNLRHGFALSDNDVILILDADFVPRPDMLSELVPYMDDPAVGIVQSPQFFDTRGPMNWLQRCAGATQELFYRMIQPSRDAVGAAICVGSCALYRRASLVTSGGFAQIGHSEDVHTGVNMLKAGLQVRYVPIVVSRGVCPDNVLGFLNQQYRWCTGSMSLLRDAAFHTAPQIGLKQRLSFWAGFLYYISTAVNAFVAPLPALVMLYALPRWITPMNSIWLLGALALWFVVLPAVMRGRWRIGVLRVQTMYSFAHAVAILDIVTGRTKEWVATGAANAGATENAAASATTSATKKRSRPLAVTISHTMKTYLGLTQVALWVGLVHGALTYGFDRYWAMIAMAVIAAWVYVPLLLVRTTAPGTETSRFARVLGRRASRTGRAPAASAGGEPVFDRDAELALLTAAAGAHTTRPAHRRLPEPHRGGMLPVPAPTAPTTAPTAGPSPHAVELPAAAAVAPDGAAAPGQNPAAAGARRWRPDIQGLRAIAVLLVVLYHAQVPYLTGGYVGVDVFFVISGFLITGQLMREAAEHGRIRFSRFYLGRVRRLLPAAALVTVVTVVAARQFMSIFQVQSILKDALATAYYGINYRLAAAGVNYQQASGTPSPLQHFWSLAVEEQFYIVFPLLIGLCVLVGRTRWRGMVTTMITLTLGVSLWLSVTQTTANPPMAYFAIHTRAWELAVGALVAIAVTKLALVPRGVAAVASWVGVAGIVFAAFYYDDATAFPGTAAILPVVATGLVIAAGSRSTVSSWSVERVLAVAPVQQLGKLSYAWYLWHWPLIVIVPIAFGYDFTWKLNLQLVVLSLWFAVLTLHLLERTTQRGHLRRRVWAAVGVGVVAATVATTTVVAQSLPTLSTGTSAPVVGVADTRTLQTQLGAALGVVKLPMNLTPSLADASHDVPISDSDGCHADFLVVAQPACVYGDPKGKHTIALIGDSHAQQWLPALNAEAKTLHWKVVAWTKAACSVADLPLNNDSLHREFAECDQWRTKTVARVKALHPDMVVMGQSDNVPGTQFSNTQWADATAKAATQLMAAKLKVVYLLDTPLPQGSGPDCVASHMTQITKCIRDRTGDSIYAYAGRHEAVANTLKQAGVATVEPANWLCAPTKCPMIVHNILVYRDASHMSASYSTFLAPMTAPLFIARTG